MKKWIKSKKVAIRTKGDSRPSSIGSGQSQRQSGSEDHEQQQTFQTLQSADPSPAVHDDRRTSSAPGDIIPANDAESASDVAPASNVESASGIAPTGVTVLTSDVVPASENGKQPDLWHLAYQEMQSSDPSLVDAYESGLRAIALKDSSMASRPMSYQLIEAVVNQKLEDREAKRLVPHLLGKPLEVREIAEKVAKTVLWSNSFISAAVSSQPYAGES